MGCWKGAGVRSALRSSSDANLSSDHCPGFSRASCIQNERHWKTLVHRGVLLFSSPALATPLPLLRHRLRCPRIPGYRQRPSPPKGGTSRRSRYLRRPQIGRGNGSRAFHTFLVLGAFGNCNVGWNQIARKFLNARSSTTPDYAGRRAKVALEPRRIFAERQRENRQIWGKVCPGIAHWVGAMTARCREKLSSYEDRYDDEFGRAFARIEVFSRYSHAHEFRADQKRATPRLDTELLRRFRLRLNHEADAIPAAHPFIVQILG